VSINTRHLSALCSQLYIRAKKPRALYLCSGGESHLSKQAAQRHSLPGWVPKQIPRSTERLVTETLRILKVLWYWRFAGDTKTPAGPSEPISTTSRELFGNASLIDVLTNGTGSPEAEETVVFGRSRRSLSPDQTERFKKPFDGSKESA